MLEAKLDFWLKNNWNVLLKGRQGIGKSFMVKDCFNRAGLKWVYFSTPTMDPWVDFVGIPKETVPKRGKSFLDFIRPKAISDNLEAIFFDEFNRANSTKIIDAVMELIQFKSINGKKLPKLKVIWAAINPDGEGFSVESLDPAQKDRFQIHYDVPYTPSVEFLSNKFGERLATTIVNWWNELSEEHRYLISPRRLEYTLDIFSANGDIRDVLPNCVNISKLLLELKTQPITRSLEEIYESKDKEKAIEFLKSENAFSTSIENICANKDHLSFFFPLLSQERQMMLISGKKGVQHFVCENLDKYLELCLLISKNNPKSIISKKLKKEILPNRFWTKILASPKETDAILNSEWIENINIKNSKQAIAAWKILRGVIPVRFSSEHQLLKLLGLLANNIFENLTDDAMDFDLIKAINHCIISYRSHFLPTFNLSTILGQDFNKRFKLYSNIL